MKSLLRLRQGIPNLGFRAGENITTVARSSLCQRPIRWGRTNSCEKTRIRNLYYGKCVIEFVMWLLFINPVLNSTLHKLDCLQICSIYQVTKLLFKLECAYTPNNLETHPHPRYVLSFSYFLVMNHY